MKVLSRLYRMAGLTFWCHCLSDLLFIWRKDLIKLFQRLASLCWLPISLRKPREIVSTVESSGLHPQKRIPFAPWRSVPRSPLVSCPVIGIEKQKLSSVLSPIKTYMGPAPVPVSPIQYGPIVPGTSQQIADKGCNFRIDEIIHGAPSMSVVPASL